MLTNTLSVGTAVEGVVDRSHGRGGLQLAVTSVTGNGQTADAIPIDRVKEILKKYGRVK